MDRSIRSSQYLWSLMPASHLVAGIGSTKQLSMYRKGSAKVEAYLSTSVERTDALCSTAGMWCTSKGHSAGRAIL